MESRPSSAETVIYEDFLAGRVPLRCPVRRDVFLDRITTQSVIFHHNIQVMQLLTETVRNSPSIKRLKTRSRRAGTRAVSSVVDVEELHTLQTETLETSAAFAELMSSVRNPRRLQECWCGECPIHLPEYGTVEDDVGPVSGVSCPSPIQESSTAEFQLEIKEEILDVEMPQFEEIRLDESHQFSEGQTHEEEDPLQI